MSKSSEIQRFYEDQKVFVTGGTGFLGQVLVEKLLRSTEIAAIYFLIRPKKDRKPNERLDKIFADPFFSKLREERPGFKNKIIPISGDCGRENLGLSREDRATLIENVNVVFHVAATLRFDENLKTAYRINFAATRTIGEMCKEMENFKAFIYVSTAYSNCCFNTRSTTIAESVYQHPVDYDELGVRLENLSDEEATHESLGNFPNTYVFTKALTESFIEKELSHLPVGIFRPSIVVSTYKEPIPGWTCSWAGAIQMTVSLAAGLLRVVQLDKSGAMNVVPVDTCIAGLIACAWDVAKNKKETNSSTVSVYNYVCPPENGLTFNDFTVFVIEQFRLNPMSQAVWTPRNHYVKNRLHYLLLRTLLQSLPALVVDMGAVVCFRKPTMLATYRKIDQLSDVLRFFINSHWSWGDDNFRTLWRRMGDEDKELFPFVMTSVCWPAFFRDFWPGIRLHLLKEDPGTVEDAKRKQERFQIANQLLNVSLYFGAFTVARHLWSKI